MNKILVSFVFICLISISLSRVTRFRRQSCLPEGHECLLSKLSCCAPLECLYESGALDRSQVVSNNRCNPPKAPVEYTRECPDKKERGSTCSHNSECCTGLCNVLCYSPFTEYPDDI